MILKLRTGKNRGSRLAAFRVKPARRNAAIHSVDLCQNIVSLAGKPKHSQMVRFLSTRRCTLVSLDDYYDAKQKLDDERKAIEKLREKISLVSGMLSRPDLGILIKSSGPITQTGPSRHYQCAVGEEDWVTWIDLAAAITSYNDADARFRTLDAGLTENQRKQIRGF